MKFASVNSAGQKAVATWNVTALTAAGSPEQQATLKSTCTAPYRQQQILRVSIPKIFVEPNGLREVTQDPHAFLCKHVDVPWHSSQQWKLQELKHETVLQGYAKIEQSKYAEVLKKSGAAGVFLDELASHRSQDSARVVWRNPDNAEGLAYLKQVQAKANGQPLAFQKGGAKALGVRQNDQSMPDSGSWRVRGVPVQWYEEDLIAAVKGAGFTHVEIISKGHARKPWLVRLQKAERIRESVLLVEVGLASLRLERAQAVRKMDQFVETVVRPAKHTRKATAPAATTAAPVEKPITTETAGQGNSSAQRERSRSPARGKPEEKAWYALRECGGDGHCFCNCVAAGNALQFEGKDWSTVQPHVSSRGWPS